MVALAVGAFGATWVGLDSASRFQPPGKQANICTIQRTMIPNQQIPEQGSKRQERASHPAGTATPSGLGLGLDWGRLAKNLAGETNALG